MRKLLAVLCLFVCAACGIDARAAILVFNPSDGSYTTKPDLTTAATAAG